MLAAAFDAVDGKFMEMVLGTPHGAELLDAGHLVSADQLASGEAKLQAILANWPVQHDIPAGLGDAEALAATALAALKGLKTVAKSPESYRAAEARLAGLVAHTLVP